MLCLLAKAATDMSSSTYTKALIYEKSFTTIEANTSGIRWEGDKPKIRVRRLVNESIRDFRSNCECAGMCSAREYCHFFSWDAGTKTCELGYMDQGWHFNYTDDLLTRKQVSINTGMHPRLFEAEKPV